MASTQISPRAAEARTLLVAAYYNSRDYDAAYRAIKALPSTDGELRAALQKIACYRGLEACKAGDLAAAKRCLDEAIALNVSPCHCHFVKFLPCEIPQGIKYHFFFHYDRPDAELLLLHIIDSV